MNKALCKKQIHSVTWQVAMPVSLKENHKFPNPAIT